jgi:hypothetical protein
MTTFHWPECGGRATRSVAGSQRGEVRVVNEEYVRLRVGKHFDRIAAGEKFANVKPLHLLSSLLGVRKIGRPRLNRGRP